MLIKGSGNGGDFEQSPPGLHQAISCDIVDLGMVEKPGWQGGPPKLVHQVRVAFLINEMNSKGKPYWVGRKFTLSLHQRSGLRKFLGQWRGKSISDAEVNEGIELDDWIGKQAQLSLQEITVQDGAQITIIDAIIPPGRGAPILQDLIRKAEYIRVKDRPPKDGEGGKGNGGATQQFSSNQGPQPQAGRQAKEADDDPIPF